MMLDADHLACAFLPLYLLLVLSLRSIPHGHQCCGGPCQTPIRLAPGSKVLRHRTVSLIARHVTHLCLATEIRCKPVHDLDVRSLLFGG